MLTEKDLSELNAMLLGKGVVERLDHVCKRERVNRAKVLSDALLMLLMRDLREENEQLRERLDVLEAGGSLDLGFGEACARAGEAARAHKRD